MYVICQCLLDRFLFIEEVLFFTLNINIQIKCGLILIICVFYIYVKKHRFSSHYEKKKRFVDENRGKDSRFVKYMFGTESVFCTCIQTEFVQINP